MPSGLMIGDDLAVAAWTFQTFKLYPTMINRAFGLVRDGKLVGSILLQNFNGVNVELSYYGPMTLSLGIVRSIAKVVLTEFNAARVTVVTSKKNKRLMKSIQRMGFKLEGTQRCYFGARDCARSTGVRFVLFRERIEKIAGVRVPVPNTPQVGPCFSHHPPATTHLH